MAAMIAGKRAPVAKLLEKILFVPARTVAARSPSAPRSFSADAQRHDVSEERSIDVDRRSDDSAMSRRRRGRRGEDDWPTLFSDVFDPFNPTRSLSQVLNLMDQMMDNPFPATARGMGGGVRRGWDAREENDALYLRIDMPGLDKEHVKVSVEQNTLIIRGEGEKESEEDESGRRYSSRIDLPPELYKMDQIRAEMKNGVLKVVVPKVKQEERKDAFQVNIE